MITLIVDTSILLKDPKFVKGPTKVVEALRTDGHLEICIPWVVQEEFVSRRTDEALKLAVQCLRSAESLERMELVPIDPMPLIRSESIGSTITSAVRKKLASWGGPVVVGHSSHGQRVLDAYFDGIEGFQQPKSRKDFPDAFIFQAIKDIVAERENVHFVCADSNLRSAAHLALGVRCHESLDDFLRVPEISELAKTSWPPDARQTVLRYLGDVPKPLLERATACLEYELHGLQFESSMLPSDNGEGQVDSLSALLSFEVETSESSYLGDGVFSISFHGHAELLVDFFLFKADYYAMEEGSPTPSISVSDWSDHYFAAQQYVLGDLSGVLSVSFSRVPHDLDEDALELELNTATFVVDELDISVTVDE